MISMRKENSTATLVEAISFDENDEMNTAIEAYDTYENNTGIRFSLVTYRDPENKQLHQFREYTNKEPLYWCIREEIFVTREYRQL